MLATVTFLALLAVINAVYHRLFGVYVPLSAIQSVGQGWQVRDYAAGLLQGRDAIAFLVVLVTAAVVILRGRTSVPVGRIWHTGLPLTVCLLGSVPALGWAWIIAPGVADSETGGFLYGHVVDGRRMVGEWRASGEPGPEVIKRVVDYADLHAQGPAQSDGSDPWFGRAEGSSVIMIQVEALNNWLLDADVKGEPVVPFLRSLAKRGLYFTNVFDDTHEGRSSDADYLAMASQHPSERDAISMARPMLDPVALPDILAERGYTTFSAHAHHPGFWNAAVRHERYGFQESLFEAELGPGETLGFGLTDQIFLQRVAPRIASLPRPYLAWLITLTMHPPHPAVPPSFRTFPLGSLEGTSLGNYFLKARHTDDAIREFLDSLQVTGALDRTTVVIYGDHTDSHRFDMEWVHRATGVSGLPSDVQKLLLDQVPLVILPPGEGQGRRIPSVGGLIDVAPTLLHLMGIPVPRSFMGRPLTTPGPGLAAQASGEVVGGDLMWTGVACYGFPEGTPRPDSDCAEIRARARDELEVSWLITRHGLSQRLYRHAAPMGPAGGTPSGPP